MIGKVINNYVIERKLGDGAMGVVYYAKHNKVDREVAIKVLHAHLFANEGIHNRFKNEANALIKLTHPNVVKIFDYVEQENFACLIMEFINGYSLDDYIAKLTGPLPSAKATSIICSVLDAVQYAHDNNIFHRDIKPANVMISRDGNDVRIMDFGIAKLTDTKNFKTTHANTQLGTPFYMSPEQIKGLPFTKMSDIYSLGVTLFEMVTGKCPYHHITSLFELQSLIVNEPLPDTAVYYPDVSIKIQEAIIKATHKSPELRFRSCQEFKTFLQTENIVLQPNPTTPKITIPVKEKSSTITHLVVGLFIITMAVLVFSVFPKKNFRKRFSNTPYVQSATSSFSDTSKNEPVSETSFSSAINDGSDTLNLAKSKIQTIQGVNRDTVKALTKNERNRATLDAYIAQKLNGTNVSLSSKQKSSLISEVDAIDHVVSIEELSKKYDSFFRPSPSFQRLTNKQIAADLCSVLQGKYPCKIPFESEKQISNLTFADPAINMSNPPSEISVIVTFRLAPIDDESDVTNCSWTLKYKKNGTGYSLVRGD